MIDFKKNINLIIYTVLNFVILEVMHKFNINIFITEVITLFIIYLLKEKKLNKKIIIEYIITLFIEITLTKIIARFIPSYIIINMIVSLLLYVIIYGTVHKKEAIKKITSVYTYINKKWNKLINIEILKKIFIFLPRNIIVFSLFILSIITVYKYCTNNVTDEGVIYYNVPKTTYIAVKEKIKIDLSFVETEKKFENMCLKIDAKKEDTKVTLSSNKINKTQSSNNTNKYGYLCFKLNNITIKDLKKQDIYLSSDSEIKLYKDEKNEIAIQLTRNQKKDLIIITITVSIITIAIFLIINYINNTKNISVSKMYLIFSSYFILLMFIFPPYQVPDEVAHFNRAYNYSEPETTGGINFGKEDIIVPKNIKCIDYANIHKSNKVYQISEIQNCLKNTKNKKVKNIERIGNQILGYITQTIGIKIADIFTNSPLIIFFSGRFLTLIVSLIITYFALKITPKYKSIFLTVATMMMLLQQMISYSYDSILNSVCILFIAYFLKFIYKDDKITLKNLIVPMILLTIIANVKIVYLPLALLLLMIPKEKFKNNKILSIFIILIIAVILSKFIDYIFAVKSSSSTGALKQLKYLLNNPFDIIKIAINTVFEKGMFYVESTVGYFGWFTIKISPLYIYVYLFLYIYLINGEESKLQKKYLIIISIILMIIAIFGAMYIVWSDYKLPYVEGVQGRYLFPLIIPTCLLFIPKKKKYKIEKKIIYSIINIILFQYIFVILFTFY